MTDKPIFTPSAIGDYEGCKYAYWLSWEKYLDFPSKVNPQPTLGTFLHVLQGAYETEGDEVGALDAEIKKIKRTPGYGIGDSLTLTQLRKEALLIHGGGTVKDSKGKVTRFQSYSTYREEMSISVEGVDEPLETIAVEKRLFSDLGPIIAAPKLDMVLKTVDSGELWVAEWKTTERDDAGWENRWLMDGQTTMQVLAAEKYYDQEVTGLLVIPLIYGRKRAAKDAPDKKSIAERPIINVRKPEPRWVSKNSPHLRTNYMAYLEDVAKDYKWREKSNLWPTTGMHTRACDFCSFSKICSGQDNPSRLVQKSYRDLQDIRKKRKAS